jgi:hypothetical protein
LQYVKKVFENWFPDDSVNPDYVIKLAKESGSIDLPEEKEIDPFNPSGNPYVQMEWDKNLITTNPINGIIKPFNPFLFFSRLYIIKSQYEVFNAFPMQKDADLLPEVHDLIDKKVGMENIRLGDIVVLYENNHLQNGYNDCYYYLQNSLVFDGTKLQPLLGVDTDLAGDIGGSLHLNINMFPHNRYFQFSYPSPTVYYKPEKDNILQLLEEINGTTKYGVYFTSDNWTIIGLRDFIEPLFQKELKQIPFMVPGSIPGLLQQTFKSFTRFGDSEIFTNVEGYSQFIAEYRNNRKNEEIILKEYRIAVDNDLRTVFNVFSEYSKKTSKILLQNNDYKVLSNMNLDNIIEQV